MSEKITLAEYLNLSGPKHKYFATRTEVDGVWFDSKKEAAKYRELKIQERMGLIKNLKLQPSFEVVVNGVKICTYVADFTAWDAITGEQVVIDVKGFKTPVYKIKKKLVEAIYGIKIVEVS